MDNGFTPTTEDARDRYADARVGEWTRFDESVVKRAFDEAYAEFDRWHDKDRAEAQVAALRELVTVEKIAEVIDDLIDVPPRTTRLLADEIHALLTGEEESDE